ncbi:MAG TPA: 2-dehydro-3-deoxygalactonokinase [Flavitalea sp.]|nr:2-dehydro-3-deoxygalactonokinase [Flavitalea sp.]
MQNSTHILSCDWGTSSFRLRLIDTISLRCIAEIVSDTGNAVLFRKWKDQSSVDRLHFYLQYLKESVDSLSASSSMPLDELCILISGMASSSVGMKELPYADLPFSLDGHSAYFEWINGKPVITNPILLISGVQHPGDVMRGEETQLAGVSSLINAANDGESIYIFPGTHSKHITVSNNRITQFSTWMTGEVFELLVKQSILSHAVTIPDNNFHTDDMIASFLKGVMKAFQSPLLNNLFSARINQLKKYLSNNENYFYLSGLLIGSEIAYLRSEKNQQLVLCSSGNLQVLYCKALECAGLSDDTIVVNAELLDNAAATGQLKIFMNMASRTMQIS